jgi:hypothetical protein
MKQIIKNYTFNPVGKTVTFGDFGAISLDRLYLITNVTAGTILYQFNNATLGGSAAGNILTLTADTSAMHSGDSLQIIYDCALGDPIYDSGSAQGTVQGNAASGAPDSGNPVKIGGVYRSAQPTLTDGQRVDAQFDIHGNLLTTLATGIAGEDVTNNVMGVTQKPVLSSAYSVSAFTAWGTAASAGVKAIPGIVFGAFVSNQNAALRYFQLFNISAAPAANAVPVWSFPIPAGTAANPGILQLPNLFFGMNGYYHNTGIAWGVSTTRATFTAATPADHDINLQYL